MGAGRLLMRAGARTLWSPDVLSRSVLRAWWCADDHGTSRMTDDGAGLISNWIDRMGGLAVTAVTAARPTWGAAVFNTAYPGVTFNGTANAMVTTTLTALPTGAVPGSLVAVAHTAPLSTSTAYLVQYGNSSASTGRAIIYGGSTFTVRFYDGTVQLTSTIPATGPHILCGSWAGTQESGRIDGTALAAPSTIATLNTSAVRLRLGSNVAATAASFASAAIRHIFITTALSLADMLRLEGWIAWDSGLTGLLPASHPYKLVRP